MYPMVASVELGTVAHVWEEIHLLLRVGGFTVYVGWNAVPLI
jgi:hypothetical protein